MDTILAVLAEPLRRRMLDALREGERSAGEIERLLAIGQPMASKHLRVLREAGLVRVRKDAQRRIYTLETTPLRELDGWLATYRPFWNGALDALQKHLATEI